MAIISYLSISRICQHEKDLLRFDERKFGLNWLVLKIKILMFVISKVLITGMSQQDRTIHVFLRKESVSPGILPIFLSPLSSANENTNLK